MIWNGFGCIQDVANEVLLTSAPADPLFEVPADGMSFPLTVHIEAEEIDADFNGTSVGGCKDAMYGKGGLPAQWPYMPLLVVNHFEFVDLNDIKQLRVQCSVTIGLDPVHWTS